MFWLGLVVGLVIIGLGSDLARRTGRNIAGVAVVLAGLAVMFGGLIASYGIH